MGGFGKSLQASESPYPLKLDTFFSIMLAWANPGGTAIAPQHLGEIIIIPSRDSLVSSCYAFQPDAARNQTYK